MNKKIILPLIFLLLSGCAKQTVTSGPPTIVIEEIPLIEVNSGSFDINDLKQYITASDSSGKKLLDDQITLSGHIDTSVISTFQIRIKATDANNASSSAVMNVRTVDTTAPTFTQAFDPIIQYIGTDMNYDVKNCGLTICDNFNLEESLIDNTRIFNTVEKNTAGNYTITYTTKDSSGNSNVYSLNVEVSEDIDKAADYLFRKALELLIGSGDYFLYGQNDTHLFRTEILNFDEIIDQVFCNDAVAVFEQICSDEKTGWLVKEDTKVYTKWNTDAILVVPLEVKIERIPSAQDNEHSFTYLAEVLFQNSSGDIVSGKSEVAFSIVDHFLKIEHFENPFIESDSDFQTDAE